MMVLLFLWEIGGANNEADSMPAKLAILLLHSSREALAECAGTAMNNPPNPVWLTRGFAVRITASGAQHGYGQTILWVGALPTQMP